MRLIYIHGFNSGPSSSSGKENCGKLSPDMPVTVLAYDSALDFPAIFAQLALPKVDSARGQRPCWAVLLGGYCAAQLASATQFAVRSGQSLQQSAAGSEESSWARMFHLKTNNMPGFFTKKAWKATDAA